MNFIHPIPSSLSEKEQLEVFYACLENSDDGFLIVDPEGNIVFLNDAYCKYLNLDRKAVIGKPVRDYIESSKLTEIARDPLYPAEHNTIHQVFSRSQFKDGEQYCIVNRANVSTAEKSIAGVAQVKFVQNTLKLSNALSQMYDELELYKEELLRLSAEKYSFEQIIGDCKIMREAKSTALKTIDNDFPVLIQGETGTGKEVFANAIHYAGRRKDKPMLRVNCAAIPKELMESEFFGYEEGSFTGASKGGKKGKFEIADGGTLFLDEIGDMPLFLQSKLLRVLQEGEIERIGGHQPIPVNVRIIAATNRNLSKLVAENKFRADLYYRLNVISLMLPPLRDHPADIMLYANSFLAKLNQQYHTNVQISAETISKLEQYRWPGNVRELRNVIERCYAMRQGDMISTVKIPTNITFKKEELGNTSLDDMLNSVETEIILETLRRNDGNIKRSADDLGIHRVTLYKKMDKLKIGRDMI